MKESVEKTLSYRRSDWTHESGHPRTLQDAVIFAFDNLGSVGGRTFKRTSGQELSYAHHKRPTSGGVLVHLTADTPGEYASAVPRSKDNQSSINTSIVPPPDTLEYMDGEAFLYVHGNNVISCQVSISDSAVHMSLYDLIRKANSPDKRLGFILNRVMDANIYKLIESIGVREIDLHTTIHRATADYNRRKAHAQSVMGAAAKHLKALVGRDNDYTEDALVLSVSICSDRRSTPSKLKLGQAELSSLSINIIENLEDDDEFKIILNNDHKITRNELNVTKKFNFDRFGKSIRRDDAWDALVNYYLELKRDGYLEA